MTLCLAFVAAACGDDKAADVPDSSSRDSAAAGAIGVLPDPTRKIPDPPATLRTDREEVQEVVDDLQDALLTAQGAGICRELTEAAQQRASVDGGACASTYADLLLTPEMAKRRRVRSNVVSVDPGARRGTALLRSPGQRAFRVELVREPGGWKLPRVDLDHPTGLPAE